MRAKYLKLIGILLLLGGFNSVHAQWSGSNPINTSSNVGIKSNNNDASLNVTGHGDSTTVLITAPPATPSGYYGPLRVREQYTMFDQNGNPVTWYEPMFIVSQGGNVGVNTDNPSEKFEVQDGNILVTRGNIVLKNSTWNQIKLDTNGFIQSRELEVHVNSIPDYVFHKYYENDTIYEEQNNPVVSTDSMQTYQLLSLEELDTFVRTNHHLPGVKSASQIAEEGNTMKVSEFQMLLLKKIEELTLYNLEMKKEINQLKTQVNQSKN